jgi:hypothetical protein
MIGVGTPPQYVSLLVSTTATNPWVVVPQACGTANASNHCVKSRGGVLQKNQSSTWQDKGIYNLQFEQNLGYFGSGNFGLDSLTLGSPGSIGGNITVAKQIVAGIVSKNFYLATWGIRPADTNLTTLNNRYTSLLSNLKDLGKIPSLSWGYTAGSYHRSQVSKVPASSLTLGGSDSARYQPHNTTFGFALDISRDLVVGVQSIATNTTSEGLLPKPILAFLDAGVPHIWLPEDACKQFEAAFNLTYNSTLGLYLVNDTSHQMLLEQNPNITFTLTNDLTASSPAINISLPYAAFDLQLTTDYPGIANNTRYFPLRQATNSTQYTLGRTFFQEAYVIADYERKRFSVHQTLFPDNDSQSLQSISPLPGTAPVNSYTVPQEQLTTGAAVGLTLAIVLIFLALCAVIYRTRKAWISKIRSARKMQDTKDLERLPELHENSVTPVGELHNKPLPHPELAGSEGKAELDSAANLHELQGTDATKELECNSIFELPGAETLKLADKGGTGNGKSLVRNATNQTCDNEKLLHSPISEECQPAKSMAGIQPDNEHFLPLKSPETDIVSPL